MTTDPNDNRPRCSRCGEPRCPRCGEGRLLGAMLGEPAVYTCRHLDYLADLRDGPMPTPYPTVDEHAARQLHPGAPQAIGAAARALLDLAWTWTRTRLRALRRPEPSFHEPHCENPDRCECWRFLLESDPTAERFMTELDNDQRRDR